jgi:hypothetical protein
MLLILPTVAMTNGDHLFMLMTPIAFLGAGLNMYVVHVNGGKMPVKMYDGFAHAVGKSNGHEPMTAQTRYPWLCDVIYISLGTKRIIASVGDLLVFFACGLTWVYIAILISRLAGHS